MTAPGQTPVFAAEAFALPPEHPQARALAATVVALCLVLLVGLWWGHLDVVAVAPGRVVAAGHNKPVQAFELATVRALLVQEGETVERDQVLLTLDSQAARADVTRLVPEIDSLVAGIGRANALLARLDAERGEATGKSPASTALRRLGAAARAAFEEEWSRYHAERRAIEAEADAGHARRISTAAHCRQREAALALLAGETAALATLQARGMVARLQWSQHERERLAAVEALDAARGEVAAAQAQRKALLARADGLRATFAGRWRESLEQQASQRRLLVSELAKARLRVARSVLRAPVRGIVHALAVPAPGAVVNPAEVLMQLVPVDALLVVQALLGNEDVGRVHPGQDVVVKLDSFNYTQFGTLRGRLARLSADAVGGPGEPLSFVAEIELLPPAPGAHVTPGPARPGMSARVEFQLGRRRVADYLLGPLRRTLGESLREP